MLVVVVDVVAVEVVVVVAGTLVVVDVVATEDVVVTGSGRGDAAAAGSCQRDRGHQHRTAVPAWDLWVLGRAIIAVLRSAKRGVL